MIFWIAGGIGYLLISVLFYSWAVGENPGLEELPKVVAIPLMPVAGLCLVLVTWAGLWPFVRRCRNRVPAWRVVYAIDRMRRAHREMRNRVRWAERSTADAEKRADAAEARVDEMAALKAKQILNHHWLEATVAAREGMAKVFTDKITDEG